MCADIYIVYVVLLRVYKWNEKDTIFLFGNVQKIQIFNSENGWMGFMQDIKILKECAYFHVNVWSLGVGACMEYQNIYLRLFKTCLCFV